MQSAIERLLYRHPAVGRCISDSPDIGCAYEDNCFSNDVLPIAHAYYTINSDPKYNRVVAFIKINPHNPTGKVMGRKEAERLKSLTTVCDKNGVFFIDDMYPPNKPA